MMRKQIVFAAALAAALAGQGRAQKPAAPLPAFTVTSVRPYVSPGYAPHAPRYDPMRLYVEGMSPMELIQEAYGVSTNQIVGLPDWAWWSKTKFTVVGTTDTPATPDQMKLMLRRLLQDRFQLQFDDVTAVQSVYELVISPAGLKVRALNDG